MSGARRRKRGCGTLLVVAMIFSLSVSAQTANKASAREKLIGCLRSRREARIRTAAERHADLHA